ncbi:MAG: penicillin-binding protein 2 [Endozoicomonadaceae bacterium]|nr:penicillin-binding protein 2 [Endozoicomonadaceae bacterium]
MKLSCILNFCVTTWPHRLRLLWYMISLIVLLIIGRLIFLQGINRYFLQHESEQRVIRYETIFASRGMITDRHGQALAVSTPVHSVWSNLTKLYDTPVDQIEQLAHILKIPCSMLLTLIQKKKQATFYYLKRHITPDMMQEIEKLNISGLYFQREYKRYYPSGAMMSPVLGLTNIDDHGQSGLEWQYHDQLLGINGQNRFLKDLHGHSIEEPEMIHSAIPGHPLTLSIDLRLQYFSYRALAEAMHKIQADSALLIMMNPNNGEILAMANYPSFNPNNRLDYSPVTARNRIITDQFEPGSIMKLVTLSAALLSKQFTLDTLIDTRPGFMMVDGHLVKDVSKNGIIPMQDVLIKSSNVGATKIAFKVGQNVLIDLFNRLGFGGPTGIDFPGEAWGHVPYMYPALKNIELSNLAYGYHMSATPLQLIRAFSAIANGGFLYPATLIKCNKIIQGERVLPKWIADSVRQVAEKVVSKGTGRRAQIPGYRIAGKTGTAHQISEKGYDKKKYFSSFIGMLPADNPQLITLICFTGVRKGTYYGGALAGPVFAEVMSQTVRILGIPPCSDL